MSLYMCTRAKSGDEVYKYERSTFIPASPLQDSNNLHDRDSASGRIVQDYIVVHSYYG